MPKVILEFDSVEEQDEISDAMNGTELRLTIIDYVEELRQMSKYKDINVISVDTARNLMFKLLEERHLLPITP